MSFQPFGYHFTVRTELPPTRVRALIRKNKKKILDPKIGPRGWLVGPVVCLWLDPYNSTGPSLFGLVLSDGSGTRVHGRAGSNLFGIALCSIALLLLGLFLSISITDRETLAVLVGLLLLIPILFPLLYWQAHRKRREAEPLVRFIEANV